MKCPCLRESPEGTYLAVKVQPRASRNEIAGMLGNELKIAVTAPPVDSAANVAVVEFLAEKLECPRGLVRLVKGQTSRHKTILLQGWKAEEVAAAIGLGAK